MLPSIFYLTAYTAFHVRFALYARCKLTYTQMHGQSPPAGGGGGGAADGIQGGLGAMLIFIQ